jgi:hypothetical protein
MTTRLGLPARRVQVTLKLRVLSGEAAALAARSVVGSSVR